MRAAIEALTGLAQETRLACFRLLVKAGPDGLPAGEIATALDVPGPTLSFHLKHLSVAGLIDSRRDGRTITYFVRFDGVRDLLAYLMEDCCQSKPEMCGQVAQPCCAPSAKRKKPCRT